MWQFGMLFHRLYYELMMQSFLPIKAQLFFSNKYLFCFWYNLLYNEERNRGRFQPSNEQYTCFVFHPQLYLLGEWRSWSLTPASSSISTSGIQVAPLLHGQAVHHSSSIGQWTCDACVIVKYKCLCTIILTSDKLLPFLLPFGDGISKLTFAPHFRRNFKRIPICGAVMLLFPL